MFLRAHTQAHPFHRTGHEGRDAAEVTQLYTQVSARDSQNPVSTQNPHLSIVSTPTLKHRLTLTQGKVAWLKAKPPTVLEDLPNGQPGCEGEEEPGVSEGSTLHGQGAMVTWWPFFVLTSYV